MAGAVRLGVVDERVIVDVLLAADDVQAVEGGLAALAVESGVDSLRTSAPPMRDGVRREVRAAGPV